MAKAYYYIKTYGCQANKAESERQAGFFRQQGLFPERSWKKAQEIFINTCSVRKAADDRALSLLAKMQQEFSQRPAASRPHVILAGCMSRYKDKLLKKYPIISEVRPGDQLVDFALEPIRQDKTQAFIQISVGCNSFCTYCVVPHARGREKSRSMKEILFDAQRAIKAGYSEITLLGQNVNSWGLEKESIVKRKATLPQNHEQYRPYQGLPPFVKLLQALSALKEIKKIRFLTANPWDFYPELIKEIGENKKIDRYLHLPVQSGSNSVLQRMNRGYTRENYLRLIKALKAADPNLLIGTDIIVGFAGESESEFADTLDLVKQVGFIVAFVAMYSPRPGTLAAKLYADSVPFKEKKRRFNLLDKIINQDKLHERPKIV